MLKKTLVAIAAAIILAVAVVLVLAAGQPDSFRVARSTSIQAPPEKILPLLANPRRHVEWSPWEKKDPDMDRRYSGAASGAGAIYEWDGDSNIGAGRIEITDASPTHVGMNLIFLRPMEAHNTAEFVLEPEAGGTRVTWAMAGPNDFPAKVMQLFFDFDTMVGGEFANGLAELKAITET